MKMSQIKDHKQFIDQLEKDTIALWTLITPEIADEMLTHNVDNYRKLAPLTVKRYAADIENGDWEVNGETIVFDEDGILRNGQHRLQAVVTSGKPIIALVVHGLPVSNHFDTFRKRTESQLIRAKGYKSCENSAIAAAKILLYGFSNGSHSIKVFGEVESFIRTYDDVIREFILLSQHGGRYAAKSYLANRGACIAAMFAKYIQRGVKPDELDKLFRIVNSRIADEDTTVNSNAGLMLANALSRTAANGDRTVAYHFDATCQAIDSFLSGKTRKDPYRIAPSGQWLTVPSQRTYDIAHQTVIAKLDESRIREAMK